MWQSLVDALTECYYCNYMKTMELKVAQIGNSRGVRLPATVLRRYGISGTVIMEEKSEGILLRPTGPAVEKLSWEETAREMAARREVWGEWDAVNADGLADVPWETGKVRQVAETKARYGTKQAGGKRV